MKKLKRIAKLIRKHKFLLSELTLYGFKRYGRIYLHKGLGIVAKYPFLCNDRRPRGDVVPTLYMPCATKYTKGHGIFVQTYAKRDNLKVASDILRKRYPRHYDIRCANVGWYRRKPVIIDW